MRYSVLIALVALPSAAYAFADATQFFNGPAGSHPATFGASGEGLYFTGAPRWASLDCSSCHQGGPQKVGLRLNADDTTLFTNGYVPGHPYQIQVELTNETEGLMYRTPSCTDPPAPSDTYAYVQCNNNGYALEIDSANGPLGLDGAPTYCAAKPGAMGCPMPDFTSDESVVAPGGDAVFGSKIRDANMPKLITNNGMTSWRFWWIAPKAGTGPLTIYVGAVDGNGGAGSPMNDQDPYGDDTVSANFFLQESNVAVNNQAHAGCDFGGRTPVGAWWIVLLAIGILQHRRRPVEVVVERGQAEDVRVGDDE